MPKISRRIFAQNAAFFTLTSHSWTAMAKGSAKKKLLIGALTTPPSTSQGIYTADFDASTGELSGIALAVKSENPTFQVLSPDRSFVYSVNEMRQFQGHPTGSVSSFTLNPKTAVMASVNQVASRGGGPTHITVDRSGKCVFAANYGGGSVVSFQADKEGRLSDAVSFFQYSADSGRPERRSHAHRVTVSPDNRFLLVNDLGLDVIHVYRLDAATARLTPHDPPQWQAAAGYGPRALRFHPNGKWAYCVNELKPTVNVLEWDSSRGVLTTIQDISLVPEGYHGKAAPGDIVFDKHARFAYITSRLDDFMATFTISPKNGKLTFLEKTSCDGQRPRHLALDPTDRWLLIANQDSDNIAVFERNSKTGKLANSGKSFPFSKPMCLTFL